MVGKLGMVIYVGVGCMRFGEYREKPSEKE